MMAISAAAPSTMAASTTWPFPERLALHQGAYDAERQHHAAAAEVADEVQRRHRPFALAPDRVPSAPVSAM